MQSATPQTKAEPKFGHVYDMELDMLWPYSFAAKGITSWDATMP